MIERFGVQLPEVGDLPAPPRGVVWHWTGGAGRANAVDLAAYHYVVEVDGTVRAGKHPVASNMRRVGGSNYAAHVGGWNSYRAGLAAAGMRGYQSRAKPGTAPLSFLQIRRLLELTAHFTRTFALDPLNPREHCTHLEVWTLNGVRGAQNDRKLDIEHLPFRPELPRHEVGFWLRSELASIVRAPSGEPARPTPTPPPLRLDKIDHPSIEHLAALALAGGRRAYLASKAGEEVLALVEVFGRRVLAGENPDLKRFVDVLADYLKARR